MAAAAPVKIGTRGTVGSLVMREIEYFSRLELERRSGVSQKPHRQTPGSDSSGGHPRPSLWPVAMTWKGKKQKGSGSRFLPKMCSAVEVSESKFSYKILKNDVNQRN